MERQSELTLQAALLDLTFDAILVRDFATDTIQFWNRGAEELYGFARDDVLGQVSHDVLQTRHPIPVEESKRILVETGRWEGELVHTKWDGAQIVVLSRWAVRMDGEQPVAILETNTDITDRVRLEQQKEEFLSAAAHDLKTPLTSLKALAQILQRRLQRDPGTDPTTLLEGLQRIEQNTNRMTAMIDELLDLSRLQTGDGPELNRRPMDLIAVVEHCVAEYNQTGGMDRVVLQSETPELIGIWDAVRVERVIANLLSNAGKYSPQDAPITVTVRDEVRDGAGWAVVSVQDHGIGIPADDLPHIFERFHRGQNVGREILGAGIGLSGAKQIVEAHGGTIEVSSQEGAGSTFTVRLPLEPEESAAESQAVPGAPAVA